MIPLPGNDKGENTHRQSINNYGFGKYYCHASLIKIKDLFWVVLGIYHLITIFVINRRGTR